MRREQGYRSSKLFWVAISLVSLFLFSRILPENFLFPFRLAFQTVATPIENIVSGIGFAFGDVNDTFSSISELKSNNARLTEENIGLRANQAVFEDTKKENEALRKELALPIRDRFEVKGAEVIARDPVDRGKWLVINRGSFDGMKKGMVVVATPGVMVGVIDEVYPQSARIMLLSHPESAIPGRIAGQDTRGVVRGEHALGMIFGMVSQIDVISDGASVVTDVLERNIPSGLLIGTVKSSRPSADRLFLEASIIAPFRYETLRFVSVLVNEK